MLFKDISITRGLTFLDREGYEGLLNLALDLTYLEELDLEEEGE